MDYKTILKIGFRSAISLSLLFFLAVFLPTAASGDVVISPEHRADDPVYETERPGAETDPLIAFNGDHYLVLWKDKLCCTSPVTYDLVAARVGIDGTLMDKPNRIIGPYWDTSLRKNLSLIGGAGGFLLVWEDLRNDPGDGTNPDIYAMRFDESGNILGSEFPVSARAGVETYPTAAFDGTNYLIAWEDDRNVSHDIYAERIGQDGTILDPDGFVVSDADGWQMQPAMAFDGTNYLVVYRDTRDHPSTGEENIYGTRVTPAGARLERWGFPVATADMNQADPRVACGTSSCYVIWDDYLHMQYYNPSLYGTMVTHDGVAQDRDGIPILGWPGYQYDNKVVFDGTNFIVINVYWSDSLDAVRIDQSGTILDPNGFTVDLGYYYGYHYQWAFSGQNLMAVWSFDSYEGKILGARFGPGLTLLGDTFLISRGANSESQSLIVPGPDHYLLIWYDNRNSFTGVYGNYVERIGAGGEPLDPAPSPLAVTPGPLYTYGAARGDGQDLVAWTTQYGYYGYDLFAARISQDGIVLDQTPLDLATTDDDFRRYPPRVAYGAGVYFVIWVTSDSSIGNSLMGSRITLDGQLLDPDGIPLCDFAGGNCNYPDVVFDGNGFLIVYMKYLNGLYSISARRIDYNGNELPPGSFDFALATTNCLKYPRVVFDGQKYFAVWQWAADCLSTTPADLYGARATPDGTVLDSPPIPISTVPADLDQAAVTFDGRNYVVAWVDDRDFPPYTGTIYGSIVSPDGYVQGAGEMAICPEDRGFNGPSLASTADGRSVLAYYFFDEDLQASRVAYRLIDTTDLPSTTTPENTTTTVSTFTTTTSTVPTDDDADDTGDDDADDTSDDDGDDTGDDDASDDTVTDDDTAGLDDDADDSVSPDDTQPADDSGEDDSADDTTAVSGSDHSNDNGGGCCGC